MKTKFEDAEQLIRDYKFLISERKNTIEVLRTLCKDFGTEDWDECGHLADILNNCLVAYLYEARAKKEAHVSCKKHIPHIPPELLEESGIEKIHMVIEKLNHRIEACEGVLFRD